MKPKATELQPGPCPSPITGHKAFGKFYFTCRLLFNGLIVMS
jgi:hypothetical protein